MSRFFVWTRGFHIALAVLLVAIGASVFAQTRSGGSARPSPSRKDAFGNDRPSKQNAGIHPRIEALVSKGKYKCKPNEGRTAYEGRITWTGENRSQTYFVYGQPVGTAEQFILLWSPVTKWTKRSVRSDDLIALLNNSGPVIYYNMVESKDKAEWLVFAQAVISIKATPGDLDDALSLLFETADEMEKALTGKDES